MPSQFHNRNERIRRRLHERPDPDDAEHKDGDYMELTPDEPGDGHIVRKNIDDEENLELWNE